MGMSLRAVSAATAAVAAQAGSEGVQGSVRNDSGQPQTQETRADNAALKVLSDNRIAALESKLTIAQAKKDVSEKNILAMSVSTLVLAFLFPPAAVVTGFFTGHSMVDDCKNWNEKDEIKLQIAGEKEVAAKHPELLGDDRKRTEFIQKFIADAKEERKRLERQQREQYADNGGDADGNFSTSSYVCSTDCSSGTCVTTCCDSSGICVAT